jgi:hypothetical protein
MNNAKSPEKEKWPPILTGHPLLHLDTGLVANP